MAGDDQPSAGEQTTKAHDEPTNIDLARSISPSSSQTSSSVESTGLDAFTDDGWIGPASPANARTPQELLRRLSVTIPPPDTTPPRPRPPWISKDDPRFAHPNLRLTGNVISASFCLPYTIEYAPGEWVCSVLTFMGFYLQHTNHCTDFDPA